MVVIVVLLGHHCNKNTNRKYQVKQYHLLVNGWWLKSLKNQNLIPLSLKIQVKRLVVERHKVRKIFLKKRKNELNLERWRLKLYLFLIGKKWLKWIAMVNIKQKYENNQYFLELISWTMKRWRKNNFMRNKILRTKFVFLMMNTSSKLARKRKAGTLKCKHNYTGKNISGIQPHQT